MNYSDVFINKIVSLATINSNQDINIKSIYDRLESKVSTCSKHQHEFQNCEYNCEYSINKSLDDDIVFLLKYYQIFFNKIYLKDSPDIKKDVEIFVRYILNSDNKEFDTLKKYIINSILDT
jgi:hypothetical protein